MILSRHVEMLTHAESHTSSMHRLRIYARQSIRSSSNAGRVLATQPRKTRNLGEHGLLGDNAVLGSHVGHQVDEAGRVAPLVVVPRDELDEGGRQHDARTRVEGGGVGGA